MSSHDINFFKNKRSSWRSWWRCFENWWKGRDLDGIFSSGKKLVEERRKTFLRPKVAKKRSKGFSPIGVIPLSLDFLSRRSHWKIVLAVNYTWEHDYDHTNSQNGSGASHSDFEVRFLESGVRWAYENWTRIRFHRFLINTQNFLQAVQWLTNFCQKNFCARGSLLPGSMKRRQRKPKNFIC